MSSERGFTLIEMIVVLAIVALIAAFALPQFSRAQATADMSSTARALAAGLRSTRSLAMAHSRSEAFSVDIAHGVYRAAGHAPQSVAKGVRLVLVTASQERIDTNTGSIRFFSDGSSSGGGIALRASGRSVLILVDWLTGRVSIVEGGNAAAR